MKAGDKVVCVDDSPCRCGSCPNKPSVPKKGSVYVVSEVMYLTRKTWIILVGVDASDQWHEGSWQDASAFRLLDELKQEAKQQQEQSAPKILSADRF